LNEAQVNLIAQEILRRIAALYAVELGRRMAWMRARSFDRVSDQPLFQSIHVWMLKTRVKIANGGGAAKAIYYSLKSGLESLPYRRPDADRQQPGGEHYPPHRSREVRATS
jgi:hypothetical protein